MKSSKPSASARLRKFKPADLPGVYQTLRAAHGPQHWWPGETPYEVIVGAILTQNTAWVNVEKALARLKEAKALTPDAMRSMSRSRLASLIRSAGYHNVKADRLKHFLAFFYREYQGEIGRMVKEKGIVLRRKLLEVKGIGPETADSILLYAAGKPFFVIDAYTRRIFSRHGFQPPHDRYEAWQALFQNAVPSSRAVYNDFHAQIVTLAKLYCRASRMLCETCPLYRPTF